MERNCTRRWRVMGQSICGSAHDRRGQPNQDRMGRWPAHDSDWVILAVADGHGSAKCCRSGRGAELAVEVAGAACHQFLRGQATATSLSAIKRTAEEGLPQLLVRRWRERVQDDLAGRPLEGEELEDLERSAGAAGRDAVLAEPTLAYGTTLLIALVTPGYIIYLQLGDGEILAVGPDDSVHRPIVADPRLLANETTSLSSDRAWNQFRFHFQVLSDLAPALILLTTDGYANSFRSEAGFIQAGVDYLDLIRTEGPGAVAALLPQWLAEATRSGSGDDVTVGLIVRVEPPLEPAPRSTTEAADPDSDRPVASDWPDPAGESAPVPDGTDDRPDDPTSDAVPPRSGFRAWLIRWFPGKPSRAPEPAVKEGNEP